MKRVTIVAAVVVSLAGSAFAFTDDGRRFFSEFLNGFKEATAVVSTTGAGTFQAFISDDETEIHYLLTFRDLEGDVRQAHIHIGHPQNQGGIVLWLCDSETNPAPADTTPACNADNPLDNRNGRVFGTLTAADVQNQAGNGIAGATATTPGELAEVIALIRAGRTYVNVHSAKFTGGEVRSQLGNYHDHRDH